LSSRVISLGLESRLVLIRVLFECLLVDLCLLDLILDLLFIDDLLVPLVNGHVLLDLPLYDLGCLLVDLGLLSELLQLSLGTQQLDALLRLLSASGIFEQSLYSSVQDCLGHAGGVEVTTSSMVQSRWGKVVIIIKA
jgi:hypothetical protein